MRRRVPLAVAIVLLILGIVAGKAWASFDTAYHPSSTPAANRSPATVAAPSMVEGSPAIVEEPSTTTTTVPSLESQVYPSVGYWQAIHGCEQPDSWTIAGRFGNGLAGGGGLGISNGAWWENGGRDFAELPGQASPVEQMIVAGRILQRYGPGAWGCRV